MNKVHLPPAPHQIHLPTQALLTVSRHGPCGPHTAALLPHAPPPGPPPESPWASLKEPPHLAGQGPHSLETLAANPVPRGPKAEAAYRQSPQHPSGETGVQRTQAAPMVGRAEGRCPTSCPLAGPEPHQGMALLSLGAAQEL